MLWIPSARYQIDYLFICCASTKIDYLQQTLRQLSGSGCKNKSLYACFRRDTCSKPADIEPNMFRALYSDLATLILVNNEGICQTTSNVNVRRKSQCNREEVLMSTYSAVIRCAREEHRWSQSYWDLKERPWLPFAREGGVVLLRESIITACRIIVLCRIGMTKRIMVCIPLRIKSNQILFSQ
jgi:hypothetical protein